MLWVGEKGNVEVGVGTACSLLVLKQTVFFDPVNEEESGVLQAKQQPRDSCGRGSWVCPSPAPASQGHWAAVAGCRVPATQALWAGLLPEGGGAGAETGLVLLETEAELQVLFTAKGRPATAWSWPGSLSNASVSSPSTRGPRIQIRNYFTLPWAYPDRISQLGHQES